MLVLVVAACGGNDSVTDAESSGNGDETTSSSVEAPASGDGDYSVIMVSGVDSVTSQGTYDDLIAAGFDGFVREGSDDTSYTVYQDGLSESEAEALLEEVRAELYPEAEGGLGPGLIAITDEWFGD